MSIAMIKHQYGTVELEYDMIWYGMVMVKLGEKEEKSKEWIDRSVSRASGRIGC